MADDDHVILQSQEGQEFKVEVKIAKLSETMKNLIEDIGIEEPIPVPNVTGKILSKVVEWSKYHSEHPTAANEKPTENIISWDAEFCKVDHSTLFELILAANFLNIKDLLNLTCNVVASMIKGKTPEEIRKTFNIVNDFTADEEMQVRKENEWVEE